MEINMTFDILVNNFAAARLLRRNKDTCVSKTAFGHLKAEDTSAGTRREKGTQMTFQGHVVAAGARRLKQKVAATVVGLVN